MDNLLPFQAGIICRPKLSGGGTHFGVQLPDGRVIHLTPDGVEQTTMASFANRLAVKVSYSIPVNMIDEVYRRTHQAMRNPRSYAILNWNCEHFANWIAGRPAESTQIDGVVILGLAIGLITAMGSN